MPDRLAALYPPAAHHLRTVVSMPIKRLPGASKPGGRNLVTPREWYGDAMFQEVTIDGGSRVGFVEKAFPHSFYDLMLLASDEEIRCSTADLGRTTARFLFELSSRFVEYLSEPDVMARYGLDGGYLHLAYNYDRFTVDRDNSMCCDKRFHLHLNYWLASEIADLAPVPWGSIDDVALRRRLLDPVAYLSEMVMRDRLAGRDLEFPLMGIDHDRDQRLGLPAGPKIELAGWRVLGDGGFPQALDMLHYAAEEAYSELYFAFVGRPPEARIWDRPRLLPRDQIAENVGRMSWLAPDTVAGLLHLATSMRDLDELAVSDMRSADPTTLSKITLAGLDYAIALFSPARNALAQPLVTHESVYLTMHCKLLADTGGAGLPTIDNIPIIRLDRSRGDLLTEDEVTRRRQLRREFLDRYLPELATRFRFDPIP